MNGVDRTQMGTISGTQKGHTQEHSSRRARRRVFIASTWLAVLALLAAASTAWLVVKAVTLKDELQHAALLLPQLKEEVIRGDAAAAALTVETLQMHTASARDATNDPLWRLASALPWLGTNFQAATEVAITADDVARHSATPLVTVLQSLDWNSLTPSDGGVDVGPLNEASPTIASAANAVQQSSERLTNIDSTNLLPQISVPLQQARTELASLHTGLQAAADFATLAPAMLGTEQPRHYLLLVENNAESRATGGIPGALAVLTVNNGQLTLGSQSSATELGTFTPPIAVDSEQQQIYSVRLGKFMQDVNLTPDFPTAASTAQAMWERNTGQRVDGVISIDPVALGYVLKSTGPIQITSPELLAVTGGTLPTELSEKNVVKTLLSDVYREIPRPQLQDLYFAGAAKEVFNAISSGKGNSQELIAGITQGTAEGRILLWSGSRDEQSLIARYPISGSIFGPSVSPAQFGVYFNDGTGAKMDFYVKRTVQLVKECAADGYEQTTVRITSSNTAPADAAASLPEYVTGAGIFGVPKGTVQTNIVSYGPSQANIETAVIDGNRTDFAAYRHADRPVGTLTVRLAPGQTTIVEMTFGKIVQHTEPKLVVTPTVQPVKEVILSNESRDCIATTKSAG